MLARSGQSGWRYVYREETIPVILQYRVFLLLAQYGTMIAEYREVVEDYEPGTVVKGMGKRARWLKSGID